MVGFIWANVAVYRHASENPRSFLIRLHLEEELVEAGILVEFGVEGYAKLVALAGGDDAPVDFR